MKSERTYQVKFSTRGRVTIPARLRKDQGIRGRSKATIEVTPAGALLLRPKK